MTYRSLVRCIVLCGPLLLAPQQANAWFFFFIPGGLFSRDIDPDSIVVTYSDRVAGKCAGFHVNQTSGTSKSEEEKNFHSAMADKVLEGAIDKEKTKEVAEAYSAKWGKAVKVDRNTNLAYGRDLASGCRTNKIPLTLAQQQAEKLQEETRRQEEVKRQEAAKLQEEVKRQEEAKKQEEAKQQELAGVQPTTVKSIDFNAEARKSALILGCSASDPKVTGVEGKNVVFFVTCDGGASMNLSCDPTGLCLKK